jgi:hypothetical protein
MHQIENIVKITLALIQPSMVPRERRTLTSPYFELYGFDILFDRDFNGYLLEINTMPSLNTAEDVDFEVKAPLIAQALSIVGIPDRSLQELIDADATFVLPPGGIAAFDDEMERLENERNRLSGDGFIKLFPDPHNPLNQLLACPTVNIPKHDLHIATKDLLSVSVGEEEKMAVLCNFLIEIEIRLAKQPIDRKLLSRVHCFLVTQGYKPVSSAAAIRALLKHFITRAQSWTTKEALWKTSAEIGNSYDDETVKKVIGNFMSQRVVNPGLLFC